MSREKKKNYAISNALPKIRPPKYPYLAEKIEEIISYFSLTQTQISEMTKIPQASISKCLGRKGSLTGASLSALSTKLPEPIPLWWLMAGLDVKPLKDVLSKENENTPQSQEPESKSASTLRQMQTLYDMSEAEVPDILEKQQHLEQIVDWLFKDAERQKLNAFVKKRRTSRVSKNGEGEETRRKAHN